MSNKPLNRKAYGSVPHLPSSRLGPGDHYISPGQAKIALGALRDKHDRVFIHEKVDGSCCAVAKVDGQIIPLSRSGYRAESSPYLLHHIFSDWAYANQEMFLELLDNGERVVGEWLAQTHSIRYKLDAPPFVVFDIFNSENERLSQKQLSMRQSHVTELNLAHILYSGGKEGGNWTGCNQFPSNLPKDDLLGRALHNLEGCNPHHRLDPAEGLVFRVERKGVVEFLCKWVRSDFEPGLHLPMESRGTQNDPPLWNEGLEKWLPSKALRRMEAAATHG